jgi:hypothetical protein
MSIADKLAGRVAVSDEEATATAYWASPVGRAVAAREHGLGFFQIEIPIGRVLGDSVIGSDSAVMTGTSAGRPDVILSEIEAVGWRLEHVGYVFVETGSTSSDHFFRTGQGTVTRGQTLGVYLFRRA